MMLVSRTPLRVSFFGGGTDYPEYFSRQPGAVVGMAIDKYIHIAILRLQNLVDYRYRLSYSKLETVQRAEELQHPVVRSVLSHYAMQAPLDISIMADLPSRSGLGSSSSFTVGFLNAIFRLQNRLTTKLDLARGAVHVERDLLGENGGVQDQYHAAFGGINRFDFTPNGTRILPLQITGACLAALTGSLFLLHSGTARYASAVLGEQIRRTTSGEIDQQLSHLIKLTDQAVDVLQGDDPERMLLDLGQMLHEGWETKKRLSPNVSGPQVDNLYLAARAAGAAGGKLCGAGSGGFMLVLVSPERQARFREIIGDVNIVRVGLDTLGSAIISNGDHH